MSLVMTSDGTGIRLSINQSLTRQTPKRDFGTIVHEGAAAGQGPLVSTLESLVGGFTDIGQFARINRPDLVGDIDLLRMRLEALLFRARQARTATTSVRIP